MATLQSLGFFILATGSFGFLAFQIFYRWNRMKAVGNGPHTFQEGYFAQRLLDVLRIGFLQEKMFKDKSAGWMHFLIFWGFLTVSLGTLETLLFGVVGIDFESFLGTGVFYKAFLLSQDWGNFMVLLAVSYAGIRRVRGVPKRLDALKKESKVDAFLVLGFIFLLVLTALWSVGIRLHLGELAPAPVLWSSLLSLPFTSFSDAFLPWTEAAVWWSHCLVLFGFAIFLPYSKHQHLIWVWPNIYFKSKEQRGHLPKLEFDEEAESFGAGKVEDFSWKQLLDAQTCVECGRCTAQCPAYATGKPLDPRKIMQDMKNIFLDHESGKETTLINADYVQSDELWSCTTCGACMEACPLEIEHIPSIVDMRRYLTMTEGQVPEELQNTFRNLETYGSPWAYPPEKREEWTEGLNVTTMRENSDVEYLFWVGCAGSFDERYKKVTQSIAEIMRKAGIKFSILGKEEKCNGDSARRGGNEYLANMLIDENVETMKRYDVKKVVTGCPHCFNTLQNEYKDFGLDLEVEHHSQLIAKLVDEGKVKPRQAEGLTTFHDSCYLGRHNGEYDAPRKLVEATSKQVTEMERSKEKGFCCGAGGARMWMEETLGTERVNENRAKEVKATEADTLAVSCPFCMTMMQDGLKSQEASSVKVKDIAELVNENLD